jgi:hypothetical protein
MFAHENVGLIGAEDKKEKKKVIKMKDVFVIPSNLKDKYSKKEKELKPKEMKKKELNIPDKKENEKTKKKTEMEQSKSLNKHIANSIKKKVL